MIFTTSKKIEINYDWIDKNKPDTFVLINVLGTDLTIWDDVVRKLSANGNVLRYDMQGHGQSKLSERTNQLEHHLNDLIELIQHLKIRRCHVIGLSVGGMIAQLMAYHHPDTIDQLVLCGTRHKIGDVSSWDTRIRLVQAGGIPLVSEAVLNRWFTKEFQTTHSSAFSRIKLMLEKSSPQGYIQLCQAIRDADLTEKTKQIKHQTLAVAGSEDGSTPPADVKSFADLIPGSKFEIILGSGHLPCVDNPEKLCSLILDFIFKKDK